LLRISEGGSSTQDEPRALPSERIEGPAFVPEADTWLALADLEGEIAGPHERVAEATEPARVESNEPPPVLNPARPSDPFNRPTAFLEHRRK
jgi:hypothetical protein